MVEVKTEFADDLDLIYEKRAVKITPKSLIRTVKGVLLSFAEMENKLVTAKLP